MSNPRRPDPGSGGSCEPAVRRFLAPAPFATDAQQLKRRIDLTENDRGYTVEAAIPDVDPARVQAKYAGGVLTLELPRAAPAAGRRIGP